MQFQMQFQLRANKHLVGRVKGEVTKPFNFNIKMKRGIIIFGLAICLTYGQSSPVPQLQEMQQLGRQNPYISIVWLSFTNTVTNIITTSYAVKHTRYIERNPDGTFETNYGLLNPSKTNILNVVTNIP